MKALLIALIVLSGTGMAIQSAINSQLGIKVGHVPLYAATWSFFIGFLALLFVSILSGQLDKSILQNALNQPWYYQIGGLMGAFVVTMVILGAPRIGVALTALLMVLGQLLMALLIDKYGFLGMPIREISWHKVIGLILVIAGVLLFNLKK